MKGYLFIGIEGGALTPQDKQNLCHPSVAGTILFSRNYEDKKQLHKLCQSIHQLRPHNPLKIAVDHEGGDVQRFKNQFTAIPSARYFMQSYSNLIEAKKSIAHYSQIAARELSACGIDINFAPCLDLDWNHSTVVETRCYDNDPIIVAELSMAFMQAHHDNNIISVAKHFPGHGYVIADSHLELPIDKRDDTQVTTDITAFKLALPHTKAIMMAHILFPKIDVQIASFSIYWIKNILRQQLNFKGLIFSDDLTMKATQKIGGPIDLIEQALSAGNDYLIWGNDLESLNHLFDQHHDTLSALCT